MPRSAHRRRLLVAPDSFKGTFSAPEVAAAIARGVRAADCEATVVPLADGGEEQRMSSTGHSVATSCPRGSTARSVIPSRQSS